MLPIVIVIGVIFIVIPISARIISKKRDVPTPKLLNFPNPIIYIAISFLIFSLLFMFNTSTFII